MDAFYLTTLKKKKSAWLAGWRVGMAASKVAYPVDVQFNASKRSANCSTCPRLISNLQ